MKKVLNSLLAAAVLSTSLLAASLWTPIADKLDNSVVYIEIYNKESKAGSCSGAVIDTKRKHVLTAAHCDGEKILVDGTQSLKVFKDERKDLLVLRAYGIDKPALKLSPVGPVRGEEVASLGYGFAFEQPMFRVAHISNVHLESEELGSGPFFIIDADFVPGQSGGPVVNQAGEIVGIVQMGCCGVGIGRGADVIKDRVGRYFE